MQPYHRPYQVEGDGVTFGPIATTQMACADSGEIERGVHAALKGAGRWKIAGNRLVIVDAAGLELAVLESGSTAPPAGIASDLEGTAWQLIKFQGSDDTTLTPDDGAKYTIEFGASGRPHRAHRLQPRSRDLEVERVEPGGTRSSRPDTGQVSRGIAARSDRQAVGLSSVRPSSVTGTCSWR